MNKASLFLTAIFLLSTSLITAQNMALTFDGTADYVEFPFSSAINPDSFTIDAWFKVDVLGTDQSIMTSRMGAGVYTGGYMIYVLADNSLAFWTGNGTTGYDQLNSGYTVTTEWTHVACIFIRVGTVSTKQIYINGILKATGTYDGGSTYTPSTVNPLRIGAGNTEGPALYFFKGKIDEVRIWSDVRTQAEIRGNMYQELVGTETGLEAYYNSNATSGTSLADNSTNSNTGTLTNMAGTKWATSAAFFGPKNALHFNFDDYVSIPSIFGLGTASVTLECWVKPITSSKGGGFIHIGNHNTGYGIGMGNTEWGNKGNQLIILYDTKRWILTGVYLGTEWHHVVLTIDTNGDPTVYLDGKNVYSDSGQTDPIAAVGNSSIGSSQNSTRSWSNGIIDEVRIWSDVRTESEIRENMCRTLIGNETNLVGYYNLDDDNTIVDYSGNGNDGILGNFDNDELVSSFAFNIWLNTDDSDWVTAANWSNGVPVATDNVGVYNYSASSPTLAGTPTVNNLLVGSSAGLTLSSDVTVNGNLFLQDDIDLNGQTITLGSTAALYEDSGLISGSTGTITTIRNLSNITAENVGGLGAEITTNANMGNTVITRGHTVQTQNSNNSIKRFFDITPTIKTGLNASLTFNYDDSELNSLTKSNLKLYKSIDGGSNWTNEGGALNTTNNTIMLTGLDGFSKWTVAEALTLSLADNIIKGFSMYPNPTKDFLNLNAQEEIKKVKIFNLAGQQLYEKSINYRKTKLNLSFLSLGNYFINIYTNNTVKSVKFVIL